jgi:putative membrane protein
MMQMGLLGAILSFAPEPAYLPHLATTQAWGLSPLADQQLAGAAMWTLGALPYLLAALVKMHRVLSPAPRGGRC